MLERPGREGLMLDDKSRESVMVMADSEERRDEVVLSIQ